MDFFWRLFLCCTLLEENNQQLNNVAWPKVELSYQMDYFQRNNTSLQSVSFLQIHSKFAIIPRLLN